jgi:two-component system, NtrC family, response regulator AtoC
MGSEMKKVLVVDDEEGVRRMITALLQKEGFSVSAAGGGEEALRKLGEEEFDLVLSDVRMPGLDGLGLLGRARALYPETTVIMMSAFGTLDLAVEAMKQGAYDYISKPFKADELLLTLRKAQERESLRRENTALRECIRDRFTLEGMVAASPTMKAVLATAQKVAAFRSSVLITGESGTGKEVLARAIHHLSPWREGPFVAINCGAIPATLLESELFGHARGAFTDAVAEKKGLFEEAQAGTLFLDEIGELPLELQVKLLRVIQEGEVRRVGENRTIRVDVRLLAATARDLAADVRAGLFREDLYYRLHVVPIHIPPLRERREDIPPLAEELLARISLRLGGGKRGLAPEALRLLVRYPWPGNVRELENILERAAILAASRTLGEEDVRPLLGGGGPAGGAEGEGDLSIKKATAELERRLILLALARTGYNRTHAAQLLEISHRALLYKIKGFGIPLPR